MSSTTIQSMTSSSSGCTGSGGPTSFQDFQESVDDAWDSGDDEFCTVSDVRISKRVSHSAALSVINNHRSSNSNRHCQTNMKTYYEDIIPEERKVEALQRLAVQPLYSRNIPFAKQLHGNKIKDAESKFSISPQHKSTQFPGRPQPFRPANSSHKFFIPSKEKGLSDRNHSFKFKRSKLLYLQMVKVKWISFNYF